MRGFNGQMGANGSDDETGSDASEQYSKSSG